MEEMWFRSCVCWVHVGQMVLLWFVQRQNTDWGGGFQGKWRHRVEIGDGGRAELVLWTWIEAGKKWRSSQPLHDSWKLQMWIPGAKGRAWVRMWGNTCKVDGTAPSSCPQKTTLVDGTIRRRLQIRPRLYILASWIEWMVNRAVDLAGEQQGGHDPLQTSNWGGKQKERGTRGK